MESIHNNYKELCGRSFAAYDPFASFSYCVLKENFSFVVKEIAAEILQFVADVVNRFSAQNLKKELLNNGIEPLLEDILNRESHNSQENI